MKLSELRACDGCGGAVAPTFFRVQIEHHVVRPGPVNALLGTGQILGGSPRAMAVARALTGDPPDATVPATRAELLVCSSCFCDGDRLLALWEKRGQESEEAAAVAADPRA